jgi:DNA-binding response OmpR family regulator
MVQRLTGQRGLPILVVAGDSLTARTLIGDLRQLGHITVTIEACGTALEMMQAVQFGLAIVEVERRTDWRTCRRVVAAARCPVAVVTRLLARDRRYRESAFGMGVTAYVCTPCSRTRIRELLRRIGSGDRAIELVDGSAYAEL